MKLKEALKQCHMSVHYKLIYEAVKANGGVVDNLYQEYCTYCKSEDIKPLSKSSITEYIQVLVKEGKLIRVEFGKYKVKEKSRIIEVRK